jgi:hypothetical protein
MDGRTLRITAAVVAVLALGAIVALVLSGGDDRPADVASTPATESTAAGDTNETEARMETGGERPAGQDDTPETRAEPQPAAPEPVRYSAYSASSGDWQTVVPSGGGWRPPAESAGASGSVRTTVRGPQGALLYIDHVPNDAATFAGEYESKRELRQPWFGAMTEYRAGGDTVGYVLNGSESGPGFRVLVRGADPALARRVANELTYVDL